MFPNPEHVALFPGVLQVDLAGIAGTVNSAVVVAGSVIGVCSTVALYNGTALVDSVVGGCRTVDTFEVFASGAPVDRLVIEACYHADVFEIRIEFDPEATGAQTPGPAPTVPLEAWPNPFAATTRISFDLESGGRAELGIYDVLGRRVVSLVDTEVSRGRRAVEWNGRDASGRRLPADVYFARLTVDGRLAASRKVVIAR